MSGFFIPSPLPPFFRMKLNTPILFGALALGVAAGVRAEDIKINVPGSAPASAPAAAPAPAAVPAAVATPAAYSEAQILEMLGWVTWMRSPLANFGFSASQSECIAKGLVSGTQGKDAPFPLEKIGPSLEQYMQKKYQEAVDNLKKKNTTDSVAYFAKLKDDKKVTTLPSGLAFEVLQPGSGDFPKASDSVKVNYTGRFIDGTVFDSNQQGEQPSQPVQFELNRVIPGFTEGLQKINKGGKIRLHVPAKLAYGENPDPRSGIPPEATLIFDIELVDIVSGAAAAPAPAPTPAPAK